MDDYNKVQSLTADEFKKLTAKPTDLEDKNKYTKSDDEDIRKIERLLDVHEGALDGDSYYFEKATCVCGRLLTMYDFVFTGLVDAGHSKSFILHTFVGTKLIVNQARPVRCSTCGTIRTAKHHSYKMKRYGCGLKRTVRGRSG